MASQPPRKTPCLSIAVTAYEEQVGVNRHVGGSKGDISRWYNLIGTVATCLTSFISYSGLATAPHAGRDRPVLERQWLTPAGQPARCRHLAKDHRPDGMLLGVLAWICFARSRCPASFPQRKARAPGRGRVLLVLEDPGRERACWCLAGLL